MIVVNNEIQNLVTIANLIVNLIVEKIIDFTNWELFNNSSY
jgi:hypothetical protein